MESGLERCSWIIHVVVLAVSSVWCSTWSACKAACSSTCMMRSCDSSWATASEKRNNRISATTKMIVTNPVTHRLSRAENERRKYCSMTYPLAIL